MLTSSMPISLIVCLGLFVSFSFFFHRCCLSTNFFQAVHHSFDSVIEYDDPRHGPKSPAEHSIDFLAQVTSREAPNHDLHLKVGVVCCLLRNLSIAKGLVKNQRVIIVATRPRYIGVGLLNRGNRPDTTHCIPRVNFDFKPPFLSFL
jgi:hypothetical protein